MLTLLCTIPCNQLQCLKSHYELSKCPARDSAESVMNSPYGFKMAEKKTQAGFPQRSLFCFDQHTSVLLIVKGEKLDAL